MPCGAYSQPLEFEIYSCVCVGVLGRALVVDRFRPHLIAWAGVVPGDARAQLAQLTSSTCIS